MKYKLSGKNPQSHYINIEFSVDALAGDTVDVQLPAWRPGRYELGNFAKNIQQWKAVNNAGTTLKSEKIKKDTWRVWLEGSDNLTVQYNYYANEMNAGSTFFNEEQLYVNPVNCFLYLPDRQNEPCRVELDIPGNYEIACSMRQEGTTLNARTYHELVDSPFICSANLVSKSYKVGQVEYVLWFNGLENPDWDKLIDHFRAFTQKQVELFGDIPCRQYHFLFQILPYTHYHGVEHEASTVISLGPADKVMSEKYPDLLGVSSHELYHTWNVKNIRPIEMMPYDYARENYMKLGYVAEGVTTYMGDVMLLKSGVFSFEDYCREFDKGLVRHFHNFGRYHRSVADSSFDTWLDGYAMGVPHRKTSIYVEGCLCAFIADTMIMRATQNQHSLHTVMRFMYERFGKAQKGYSQSDYKELLEEISGVSFTGYFEDLVWGTGNYLPWLEDAAAYLGCKLQETPNPDPFMRRTGIKYVEQGKEALVTVVAPGSPGEQAGVDPGDKLECPELIDETETPVIALKRNGIEYSKELTLGNQSYFELYGLQRVNPINENQQAAFDKWST